MRLNSFFSKLNQDTVFPVTQIDSYGIDLVYAIPIETAGVNVNSDGTSDRLLIPLLAAVPITGVSISEYGLAVSESYTMFTIFDTASILSSAYVKLKVASNLAATTLTLIISFSYGNSTRTIFAQNISIPITSGAGRFITWTFFPNTLIPAGTKLIVTILNSSAGSAITLVSDSYQIANIASFHIRPHFTASDFVYSSGRIS